MRGQRLSLFNDSPITVVDGDDATIARYTPPQEDPRLQFAFLNAQLLKEGKIDAETYRSALAVLNGSPTGYNVAESDKKVI